MPDNEVFSGEGTTAVAMKVEGGHVILKFPHPVGWLKLEPQQALELAGGMVRAGMEAKTGKTPTDIVISQMIGQVQQQITVEKRMVLVNRIILMRKTMDEQKKSMLYQAEAIVDRILSDTK